MQVLSWYGGAVGLEYDASADMWSVGVILYILLCGFPPFFADSEPALVECVRAAKVEYPPPYWSEISAAARSLVGACLARDPLV